MIPQSFWKKDEFFNHIIASDDDDDYQESGWVCVVKDSVAYLAAYGHCSCYGTFSGLVDGGVNDNRSEGDIAWNWSGTIPELVEMAARRADPNLPERQVTAEDTDFDHLLRVYQQVLDWAIQQAPIPEFKKDSLREAVKCYQQDSANGLMLLDLMKENGVLS